MTRKLLMVFLLMAVAAGAQVNDNNVQKKIFNARNKVMPALVHIQPVIKDYNTGELKKQSVIGSGIIFHPDGYVVTNYHVAGKAERIICTLNDKEIVSAKYVGGDPATDIAVLKLLLDEYKGKISVAEFGDSDSLQVGQYVMAMGSPLSLSRTVSFGVVSTRDRYFSSDVRLPTGESTGQYNLWIQTDAAINPGNSGGPLVDLEGRIVGINSRATMFANSIGFAIPINIVKEVTTAILKQGEVQRSWIGVHCQALQELENYFSTGSNEGVLISSIDPGSPAEEVFLKAGDVILEVDGEAVSARFVEELPAFYNKIARHKPGSEIALKVLRDKETYNFNIVTKSLGELQGEDFECRTWGFAVKGLTRHMRLEYQLKDSVGVIVSGVKDISPADLGGLRRSDVVIKINKNDILDLADFIRLYNELSAAADKILLTVKRGGSTRLVFLNIDKKEGVFFNEE
ncbi:MAG: trypsin-like peptidase domain-containing protein [candidate division Zixibacteria bacterium]|nr:trypsin-like peptidase domain-containing protein [candidate division Zixibacteria bacterium]MDD5426668.1 trypsin-like peptidase domain-containing protein [candidate division Zixibacteria bacterium]